MVFKLRKETHGHHTHVDVFVGPDEDHLALTGTLVMHAGEAASFESHFPPSKRPPLCKCESWYVGHAYDCPEYKEP